jgi:glycerol-3-phosphate acyltransferase PlsY
MMAQYPILFYGFVILIGYLIGSIPCGLLLGKWMGAGDIRNIGSGNIGATNALRTGNKILALLTLIGDIAKGSLAAAIAWGLDVWLTNNTLYYAAIFAGVAAMVGHIFPVWLKFTGGKGVATMIGVMLLWSWMTALAFLVTWLVTARLSRYSSLGALIAALHAPVYALARGHNILVLPYAIMAALIFFTHRANIQRLLRGEESTIKLSQKS